MLLTFISYDVASTASTFDRSILPLLGAPFDLALFILLIRNLLYSFDLAKGLILIQIRIVVLAVLSAS